MARGRVSNGFASFAHYKWLSLILNGASKCNILDVTIIKTQINWTLSVKSSMGRDT